jgi:predicted nucleotidyltransferase component of viral defense system
VEPKRPQRVDPFAEACLQALAACPAGAKISLGGAFGIFHYHEFRATNDVDAWWDENATRADQQIVVETLRHALSRFGRVSERRHGDVVSVELAQQGKTVFSFQIARRSGLLEPSTQSPWPPVRLDSLADLVAAKMSALVERGAPRDFLDVRELCRASLATPESCWTLWQRRERARGVTVPDRVISAEAVLLHLSRIERMRPLESIAEPSERERARELRDWFKHEFVKA